MKVKMMFYTCDQIPILITKQKTPSDAHRMFTKTINDSLKDSMVYYNIIRYN